MSTRLPDAAPHLHEGSSTAGMMWTTTACLLPAGGWGVWMFGLPALAVIVVAVAGAVVGELAAGLLSRRFTLADGSAVLSGLLVGYMLPPGVPLYVPAAASLFAMLVVKAAFGGLGANWMNPALGGQVFVYFAWTRALSAFGPPRLWPAGDSAGPPLAASPLQFAAEQASHHGAGASGGAVALLHGYPASAAATAVSQWTASNLRVSVDAHFLDLLAGVVPGDIGTVSPLLLALGAIYLFRRRIITWQAPAGFLFAFVLLVWVFGGLPESRGWFAGMPLLQLLTGGTVLGALFLCTDPVTSPLSSGGMGVFGLGIGIFAFLLRSFGPGGEAVFMAILLMNIAVPAIDRLAERKRVRR